MERMIDETELARLEQLKEDSDNNRTVYGGDTIATVWYQSEAANAVPALIAEIRRLRAEAKQGGIDYCALMDRHDAQFVRAEKLSGEVNWLAEVCATHCRDKSFDNAQCSIQDCAPIHCYHASAEQWKEAAREAANADRE